MAKNNFDLPAMEIPMSIISVGKNICIIEAKIRIQRTEKSPAPHELKYLVQYLYEVSTLVISTRQCNTQSSVHRVVCTQDRVSTRRRRVSKLTLWG